MDGSSFSHTLMNFADCSRKSLQSFCASWGLHVRATLTAFLIAFGLLRPAVASAERLVPVTLAWDASVDEDVVNYRLFVGGVPGVYTNTIDCGTNLVGTVPNLTAGRTYYFVVRAVDSTLLESVPSNEVTYLVEEPSLVFSEGFVTLVDPGTPRNDFSGFIGMALQIGDRPLLVKSLGRLALPGNSGSHLVKLVSSDGVDVPGAAVEVSMAGSQADRFVYAQLQSGVLLQASKTYYLLSQEFERGDYWCHIDTVVDTTSDVAFTQGAWASSSGQVNVYGSPGMCHGPLDFTYSVFENTSNSTDGVLQGQALGTVRNDFSGWVGMKLKPRGGPLVVTSLGRYNVQGSWRPHVLKLVDAVTGADVAGATVILDLSGKASGQYAYQPLASPVTLSQDRVYYLLSNEAVGGDSWYNADTSVTPSGAVDILAGAWGFGSGAWYEFGNTNHLYGPVNLTFTNSPAVSTNTDPAFVTSIIPSRPRNDFSGYVGYCLKVGDAPLAVTELGRFMLDGNKDSHVVKIVNAADGVDVPGASATVSMSGGVAGRFVYARLNNPVTLQANTTYFVASLETTSGDTWSDWETVLTTTAAGSVTAATWQDLSGKWNLHGSVGNSYGPANFIYTTSTNKPSVDTGELIQGQNLGTSRSDFTGWVGAKLRVGDAPMLVSDLGRIVGPGNRGIHMLKLVRANDGSDVPGGGCSVDMTKAVQGQTYLYARLQSPVTLDARTDYYLLSSETAMGDSWYHADTTVVSSPAATIASGAWGFQAGQWYEYGKAQSCYGPVNLRFTTDSTESPTTKSSFVMDITAGTARNDFSGYVGFRFVVGDSPLIITDLGRYVLPGNTQDHVVKLVRTSDGGDVPGGTVTVPTGNATGGRFQYTPLAAPLTLAAGTEYLLVTLESSGGDTWLQGDTLLMADPGATILSAAWSPLGGMWYSFGGLGQSYGPVDFKFQQAESTTSSLITSQVPGTVRNDFTGWVGLKLEVGSRPMKVNTLGRFMMHGNTGVHMMKLINAANGSEVAGSLVTVSMAGGQVEGYVYAPLPAPVTLAAGGTYYLLSSEVTGGDTWLDIDTAVTANPAAVVKSGAWANPTGGVSVHGEPGMSYGTVNLEFQLE